MYISIDLCGGLGNQLFQIAFVYSLCYKYNAEPIFLRIDFSPSIFKNRPVYFSTILKKINTIKKRKYDSLKFTTINEQTIGYNTINLHDENQQYKFVGYFQTEKYFKQYKEQILDLFSLDEEIKQQIKQIHALIKGKFSETISMHIRRGDYLKLSKIYAILQKEYYDKAISHFSGDSLLVVFSDDINWCKQNLNYKNMFFVENIQIDNLEQEVIEIQLISMCDHNIIANSSFSWWGAWLNENENKKVIAPKKWFKDEKKNREIKDIYCENWITI